MNKVILLNGPPRCGKDTVANYICRRFDAHHHKHALILQRAVSALFAVPWPEWQARYEPDKDTPWETLEGLTPRQAMIWVSEEVMKPRFGHTYFGRKLAATITAGRAPLNVISDCGFQLEQDPIISTFGAENCILIRIHRPGTSFANDSRSYITAPCTSVDLPNTGGVPELYERAERIMEEFLWGAN